MVLLITVFVLILVMTMTVVMVATAPAKDAKTIQARMNRLAVHAPGSAEIPFEASELLRKEPTSRFGWLDRSITEFKPAHRIETYVKQSGVKTTAGVILVQSLVCAAIGFGVAAVVYPWLLVEAGAACLLAVLPWIRITFMRNRRMRAFDVALAHAIDMMARALRAGHSVAGSIEIVAQGCPEPGGSEFAEVFRQQNFGLPMRDALMQMLDRVPSQDLRVLVTAILVQRDTGGNLVEILDRTVTVIRERQRIQGEIRVQTAQGRLTGWILTALPVVMLLLINLINPGYSKILFTDPTGRKLIYTGIVFIMLGAFFIRQIINSIEV
ncbi:MAG TPA: type II secretion system F family protein [Acidobacteriaceae bacterium]|nr:type II secretion system F family protein [Acidobacteriaceae bacterium]